jgi:hypothetical protein
MDYMDKAAIREGLLAELKYVEDRNQKERADQVRAALARLDAAEHEVEDSEPETTADSRPLERAVPRKARKES